MLKQSIARIVTKVCAEVGDEFLWGFEAAATTATEGSRVAALRVDATVFVVTVVVVSIEKFLVAIVSIEKFLVVLEAGDVIFASWFEEGL